MSVPPDKQAAAPGDEPAAASTLALPPSLQPQAPLDRLLAAPTSFRFFQAVRLLYKAARLDGSRIWSAVPVRFGVRESLHFPPNEIHDLHAAGAGDAAEGSDSLPRMVVQFFGLTGPSGVLPHTYTRWLIERARRRDRAPRDFLDIFNHRLLLLFWHAWRKHRPDITLDFDPGRGITRHVFDLVGVGTPTLYRQLHAKRTGDDAASPLPAAALAYYAGLISQRPHGLGSISQVVGDVARAPVIAHGCFGNWQSIATDDRTRLGMQAHALGDGCVLGTCFWDRQTTIELVVGPLDRERFDRLLPGGPLLRGLVELTRFLTGLALDLRIRLALRADQVPRLRLDTRNGRQARLGWNTWLSGRRSTLPANEARFHFSAMGDESWR